jgi:hypothetical protein
VALSDSADAYDSWNKARKEDLEKFVLDNPQWYGVLGATVAATATDVFGLIVVDLLRLDEGMAETYETGRVTPLIQDLGRAAVIAGPLAKALGTGVNAAARGWGLLRGRFMFKTVGMRGPCVPTSLDRALLIAGQNRGGRLFVTFENYLRALGKSPAQFAAMRNQAAGGPGVFARDLLPFLHSIGKKVAPVFGITTEAQLIALIGRTRNVVTFAIKWTGPQGPVGHQVLAYRNAFGKVVFNTGYGKECATLAEVIQQWRGAKNVALAVKDTPLLLRYVDAVGVTAFQMAGNFAVAGIAILAGVEVIDTLDGPQLAIELGVPPQELEKSVTPAILQAAGGAVVLRGQGKRVMRMPPIEVVGRPENAPPRPDCLTGVQWRLNAVGHGAGPVDGIMGPMTRHAVKAFQREQTEGGHRMLIDGIPGPQTQRRLVEVLGH